jgi:hypothetical protein
MPDFIDMAYSPININIEQRIQNPKIKLKVIYGKRTIKLDNNINIIRKNKLLIMFPAHRNI